MLVKVDSVLFHGLETVKVQVEVNVSSRGLPAFDIVGLGGRSVEESRHRIKAAIQNSGFEFPNKKITVNLAPADIVKEGSHYDLPICVAIISSVVGFQIPEASMFFGELSLDGEVRYGKGVFLLSMFAKENKYRNLFVPIESAGEAFQATKGSVKVFGVRNIKELVSWFLGQKAFRSFLPGADESSTGEFSSREIEGSLYESILGQEQLKRSLAICAAGAHNLIITGPPGSGKSMSAKALAELLPPLIEEESVEVTKIYSLVGALAKGQRVVTQRPFRQPHHTSSYAGLIGGGSAPVPGEATLAHRGVLFLDEFSEFNRNVLEALRQPMENGYISLSRSGGTMTFPAKFILVAASNPCPCGYYGDPFHDCKCPQGRIDQYRRKMSGPIMDRIDLHVTVRSVENEKLGKMLVHKNDTTLENFLLVKKSVIEARKKQEVRFVKEGIYTNAEMGNEQVRKFCLASSEALGLLSKASSRMNFSARTYFKLLKISRTIADLEESEEVKLDHMAEAIQYRAET